MNNRYGFTENEQDWDGLTYKGPKGNDAVPEHIARDHPDAKMAKPNQGNFDFIISLIFAAVFIAVSVFNFYNSEQELRYSERLFAEGEQVQGMFTNSWISHKGTGTHRRDVRYATYTYTYGGTEYKNTVSIGTSEAHSLGIYDNHYKGRAVTVHVDRSKPSESRIYLTSSYLHYLWLIGVVVGIIALANGLWHLILCKRGRMVIYNNGKRDVWKKI